jgi:hypothetical protein
MSEILTIFVVEHHDKYPYLKIMVESYWYTVEGAVRGADGNEDRVVFNSGHHFETREAAEAWVTYERSKDKSA